MEEEKGPNYDQLIWKWYEKAVKEDYFSKFIFLYLAFIASLRKRFFVNSRTDRDAINSLKHAKGIKKIYLEEVGRKQELNVKINRLIKELKEKPLENISMNNERIEKISIKNENDWENLIEFIYVVRNNIFHGEKNPEEFRDLNMVWYAYYLLQPLVTIMISYGANNLGVEDYDLKKMKEIMKKVLEEEKSKKK